MAGDGFLPHLNVDKPRCARLRACKQAALASAPPVLFIPIGRALQLLAAALDVLADAGHGVAARQKQAEEEKG
jgi:hypothetical protein